MLSTAGRRTRTRQAYQHAVDSTQPAPQQQVVYVEAPPAQAMPEAPPTQDDVITQLERLGALKAQGLITQEEFDAQKAKLLGL